MTADETALLDVACGIAGQVDHYRDIGNKDVLHGIMLAVIMLVYRCTRDEAKRREFFAMAGLSEEYRRLEKSVSEIEATA